MMKIQIFNYLWNVSKLTKDFIGNCLFISVSMVTALHSAFSSYFKKISRFFVEYANAGYEYLFVASKTVYRDALSLIRFIQTNVFLYWMKFNNQSVPKIFQKNCQSHPKKVLFLYENQKWTFEQVDIFSNRIANYFLKEGYEKGNEIALFMENRPEYVALWLGLAKAGLITALVNNNQCGKSLLHSMTVIDCKAIIYGSELSQDEIKETLLMQNPSIKFYIYETSNINIEDNFVATKCLRLNDEIKEITAEPPQDIIDATSFNCLLYIYTSGTEGLPKAAIIKNSRFIYIGAAVRFMINIRSNDILYTSLPLYHLAAGTLGVCQSVVFGNTMVIRNKFSASNFWKDCIRYNCTIAQYIGEICRYLLLQPCTPYDRAHNIRLMFGNGLRPNIWRNFVDRFNIKQIGELYGSTEGNANIINVDNKEGACGFISQIAPCVYPATLIKVDENTGEPIRDNNGLCVKVKPGEIGQFVGKITNGNPTRAFDGYANKEATLKKIIHDVFSKGDCAFASGDLLFMDRFGYLFFKDRCGDTYRWKGENVSTMEVEAIISNTIKLSDCVVFGVEIPFHEGKAGMAVILDQNRSIDLNEMLQYLSQRLPHYMIPTFIRLVDHLEVTSTHKMLKMTYKKQGFDPKIIKDPLYFFDSKEFEYIPMTNQLHQNLIEGKIRI
ncbi:Long-chain fatty acid transport protein 1 [Sarcoptes scabiei]|nr:Long-chain fatty acid transport protein 1 [Sarcoptes scabiei]